MNIAQSGVSCILSEILSYAFHFSESKDSKMPLSFFVFKGNFIVNIELTFKGFHTFHG